MRDIRSFSKLELKPGTVGNTLIQSENSNTTEDFKITNLSPRQNAKQKLIEIKTTKISEKVTKCSKSPEYFTAKGGRLLLKEGYFSTKQFKGNNKGITIKLELPKPKINNRLGILEGSQTVKNRSNNNECPFKIKHSDNKRNI